MPAPTRVLVTGDRNWRCSKLAERIVARLVARLGSGLVVAHGAAPGVDEAFELVCVHAGFDRDPHPAA